jgi:hypothetical protein
MDKQQEPTLRKNGHVTVFNPKTAKWLTAEEHFDEGFGGGFVWGVAVSIITKVLIGWWF